MCMYLSTNPFKYCVFGLMWFCNQNSFKRIWSWKLPIPKQAYCGRFWMGRFAGRTPKPHRVWSNDSELVRVLINRAGYMSREQQRACSGQTTRKYIDSAGVKRCVGLKEELRSSQWLVCLPVLKFLQLLHLRDTYVELFAFQKFQV